MPRVRILRPCFDNIRRLKEGEVVEWPTPPKGQQYPSYVQVIEEEPTGKGKSRAAAIESEPEPEQFRQDDVI